MAANDPNFGNVVALLHADGADNGTTFTDVKGHSFTRVGNTVTKTGTKKYGTAGLYFDGSGDSLTSASHADWNLGSGDFTIEFWVNPTTGGHGSAYARIFEIGSNATDGGLWIVANASENPMKILVQGYRSAAYFNIIGTNGTLANGTWAHVALVKASGVYTLYVDGTQYNTSTPSPAYTHVQGALWIGNNNLANESFNGYIDDLRITKGVARYTGSFTPPAVSHPDYGRYIAGGITESTDHTDWTIRTHRLDTGAFLGEVTATGSTYECPCAPSGADYSGPVVASCIQRSGVLWVANTAKSSGDYVIPVDPVATPYVFKCTVGGTTHGTTEPTWDTTPGNTTSDNTVTWTCQGAMVQPLLHGPLIPSI
jgi:hypothetical protein